MPGTCDIICVCLHACVCTCKVTFVRQRAATVNPSACCCYEMYCLLRRLRPLLATMQDMVKQEQSGTAAQNGQAGHVQNSQDQAQQHTGIPDPLT